MQKIKEKKPIVMPPVTFQKRGVWVEKPRRCEILACPCGNKYLKTRKGQETCVRCINRLAGTARR